MKTGTDNPMCCGQKVKPPDVVHDYGDVETDDKKGPKMMAP